MHSRRHLRHVNSNMLESWEENYIDEAVKREFKDLKLTGIEYWILCDVFNKSTLFPEVREILGPLLLKSDYIYKQYFDNQYIFGFKMRKETKS
jgi:hypothetical protein